MPDSPLTTPSSIPDTNMLQAAYDELGDDDSELSALTEDEGDPDEANRNNTRSVQPGGKDSHAASGGGKGPSSSSSASTLVRTRKSKNDAASGTALKSKQNASSGKRKRNSIVPAPMWGWAGVKNLHGPHNGPGQGSTAENGNGSGAHHPAHNHAHINHGSSSHSGGTESVIEEEEEEEEEFRGPPAMEEEEEDEDNSSGGVPRTSGGLANGSHHHHAHHGHSAAAGADGEKHGRRARVHRTGLHGLAKATTRHKGGSGSGPAGDAEHTNGSEADPLSVSGEETEEGTHKRSAAKPRTARSTGTRKKDKARGEDGDDDYVGEENESEAGVAGRRQHYKKHTTRKAAATAVVSSKKDTSKIKEAAGVADEARNGSGNNDDDDEEGGNGNGHGHGTSRKPRSSKGRTDFRSMGQGQQTDSDDDYVWLWDRIMTRHSSEYPALKRKRRMTSKEMEVRDREKAKGLWIPASRRRPPTEEDADVESPRDSSPISDINNDEELNDEEMDATAPSAKEIGHINAAAAASSIMAGSGVILESPESPQSSDSEASSSRSVTPPPKQSANHTMVAMSKSSPLRMPSNAAIIAELNRSPVHAYTSPSAAARRQAAEALGDLARDVSPIPRKTGSSPGKNKASAASVATSALADDAMDEDPPPSEPEVGENSLVGNHRRGGRDAEDKDDDQDVEPEVDQDVDQEQEQEPEPEPEPELGQENEIEQEPEVEGELDQEQEQEHDAEQELDIDHDHDHDEDHDQDGEQDPEVDMLESDLQPAHRAEALDVLASIELKFALLRERVYVEKMESFAWEEELIIEAVHPELVHLQKELTKRKAKRLELAFKKRDYETANAKKRRRVDEGAVWSWWMNARDELQTEMIAETNRKRRRLERERRAFERPLPVRRIPQPSLEVHITHPPSIRKIMESFPFPDDTQDDSRKKRHTNSKPLVYPEVTSLSSTDVANDLDFIYQQRRQALNSVLPHNQQHLQPGAQLAPTLYDVSASLYGGHHILGPGRPGPGVGIIGPGGISTLPPAIGVGVGMNHMGGMTGVGMGVPNGLPPPPGLGPQHGLQHPLPPPVPHHGPPPPPPSHSVPPHSLQQQMPIHPHPSHSQPHTHHHSHHSHPHPSSAPPGPLPSGYSEFHDAGGPVMYGPSGPPPAGRAMARPPQLPPPQLIQSSTSYQQPPTNMHSAPGVPPRERDRDRDREREQQGDMSPFTNSFPGHNGPVSGGPPIPPSASGGSARLGGHALPGYGHRGDAEYEYEQQQREKDRERERDREREAQRREDIEPSSQGPPPLSAHQQQPVSGAASSGPTHGGGYMQPSYYGPPRDRDVHSHAHGGPHEPPSRREGRDVIEGREKDAKGARDGRDPREGGRRSISPVNVGGSTKQPWMGQGVSYNGRSERADPVEVDEEKAAAKERDRRDWDRKEKEIERDRARVQDAEREYQQEIGKRDYHRQHFIPQHRPPPPPPPPPPSHMHPMVSSQHSHHHPVASYHHHHGSHHHHVVHHHHGQSQPPSGHASPQNAPLRSPRARDADIGRPHSGPGLLSTTEVMHPASSKPGGPAHWKQDDHVERRERERDREMRAKHGSLGEPGHSAMVGPPISGRPPSAPVVSAEESDRPLAVPFVMASSNAMQTMSGGSSSGSSHGTAAPVSKSGWLAPDETDREREREHDRDRKRERDWERERERERERDLSYRLAGPPLSSSAPPGYQTPHDGARSPVHRYSSNGSGSSLLSRGAPVPLQNLSVSHSPSRSRQMPPAPAYPRSPTRYGPSAASTTGSPSETSTLSVGVSGPGMPSPINLKVQPLLGSSLPTAVTGSPKGAVRPFSPPIYDSNLEGVYSPGTINVVPRSKSPRESHQMEGGLPSSTTPQTTVSTPPGPAVTKLGAPVSEREREDVIRASSPTPVKAIGMVPLQTQTSNNVGTTSSGTSKMSVGQILDRQE
ncbi:hypothetical protein M378DRAFT_1032508 [Amanita muscaria Koide BX008]|uniref:Uncharacterized protein n=1 Tax=Amanita muscaria (strain Koide BX008) TaxID=946122 RepID=A0A0C2XA09_AMAMK|nr:hypothetical protein M378DRAFT_1032508 [Amanita muscaria Koide BX008]